MGNFVRSFKARKLFLDQLEVGASLSFAANAAGGKLANFKAWRNADPNFAKDWDDAIEEGTDFIEDVALKRALDRSDPLIQMFLKARRPEKFDRGSKLELSGGISVEGSKSKLLNKIARIQAQSRQEVIQERKALEKGDAQEVEEGSEESGEEVKALPAPDRDGPDKRRGSKRRAAHS